MKDICELKTLLRAYTTPFFSTSNVEMVEYVDPQKVVA